MSARVFLAALATIIIWGASPVATKFAVLGFPPLTMAAGRTLIGGLCALPLILAFRIGLPQRNDQRFLLLASAAGGFIVFPVLFTLGMSLTSGIHGAMILAFLPVTTGAIAHLWDRRFPDRLWWAGCAMALVGEMVLTFSREITSGGSAELTGDLLIWASLSFASMGYVSGARLTRTGYPAQGVTYWGVVLCSLILLPFVPFLVAGLEWPTIPLPAWAGLIYMGTVVTVLAYIFWYYALSQGGIERVGLFQFFQPVVGVITAAWLLHERLSPWLLVAAALILGGVYIATRAPRHIVSSAARTR